MELGCHVLGWSEQTRWTDTAYQSWRLPRYECESTYEGAAPPTESLSDPLPRSLPLSQQALPDPLPQSPPVLAQ